MRHNELFTISREKRLRTYFGVPTTNTCAKPYMWSEMPVFEYHSDNERFTNCACSSQKLDFCPYNDTGYYSF